MISLLHEKDYELLGNIEVREADWLRIRRLGLIRFVLGCCSSSFGGRIGAGLILLVGLDRFGSGSIGTSAWLVLGYGAFCVVASAVYALRAWQRLELRFGHLATPNQNITDNS